MAISVAVLLRGVQQVTQPVIELQQGVSTEVARLLRPTPTIIPDPVTLIHEVQSLARLETIHYPVEKVITAETRQGPFGFLRRGDVELESAARLAAEKEILEAALSDGILEQAQVNAEAYLLHLLGSLGFSNVRFTSE